VLAYHNIVPEGETPAGDLSLHLSQRRFAAQLDALRRTHEVVPLSTLLDRAYAPTRKPRVVITFDDAYRGAVTAGVAELAARGMPATIFVAPHFVNGGSFWWDAFCPDGEELPDSFRSHALEVLAGREADVRAWVEQVGGHAPRVLPAHARAATIEELRAAVGHPGITLGSHTWSHPNLARSADADVREELERPLNWLRAHFDAVVPWIAYPYGISSPAVERAAAGAGYEGALRVSGGWLRQGELSRFALPRLNVPAGLSTHGFTLRTSGLLCR
jgi:peptidoglycan/xylan/chitin deacetylase (PgdA/CDA1 family)